MRLKKSCQGCRASEWHNECSIGYSCDGYVPKEPCPKPRTYDQLINSENIKGNHPKTK